MKNSILFLAILIPQLALTQLINPFESSTNSFRSRDVHILHSEEGNNSNIMQQFLSYGWSDPFGGEPSFEFEENTPLADLGDDGLGGAYHSISIAADINGDHLDEVINLVEENNHYGIHVVNHSSTWNEIDFKYDYSVDGISGIVFVASGGDADLYKYIPRMIAADFDGDSQDEIVLAWKSEGSDIITIQIFESNGSLELSLAGSIAEDISLFDPSNRDSYNIGAGDFNNDGKAEIVLSGLEENPDGILDEAVYVQIYEVDTNSETITAKGRITLNDDITSGSSNDVQAIQTAANSLEVKYSLNETPTTFLTASFVFNFEDFDSFTDNSYLYRCEVSSDLMDIQIIEEHSTVTNFEFDYQYGLLQGNIDGSYPNEVLQYTHSEMSIYQVVDDQLQFIGADEAGSTTSKYFSADLVEVDDIDSDGKDEVIAMNVLEGDSEISYNLRVYGTESSDLNFELQSQQTWEEEYNFSSIAAAFSVGNFDGSDLQLGEGTSFSCEYKMPVLNLGAIPSHFDYLNGEYYDISACYDTGDGDECEFSSQYKESNSESSSTALTMNSDWSASAGVSGGGLGVKASLEGKYGEKFANTANNSTSFSFENTITTTTDDALMSYRIPLIIWEYPVMNAAGDTVDYIISAFPDTDNADATMIVQSSKSFFNYLPNHEVGNLLSYPAYDMYEEYPDFPVGFNNGLEPIILNTDDLVTYAMSSTISTENVIGYSESFSKENSSQWEAGISAEVEASGFGFGAKVKGEYNMGELNISNQSVSETKEFRFNLGMIDGSDSEYGYEITPRIYWGNHGATVVAFDVEPSLIGGSFWADNYTEFSDPALILPWKFDTIHSGLESTDSKIDRSKSMYFSNYSPALGESVSVHLKVLNYSFESTGEAVEVSFYHGHPSNGNIIENLDGESIFSTSAPLGERGRELISMNFEFTQDMLDEDLLKIYAVLDPNENLEEVHENNNVGWSQLGYFCNDPGDVTSVEEQITGINPEGFKVYPNPANEVIKIEIPLSIGKNLSVNIMDSYGRLAKVITQGHYMTSEYTMSRSVSDLSPGIYFVTVAVDGFTMSRKFVKM